ncbi:MAG TPA: carbon-nitrogen hydrolase family protein [bacterium]|nr:carbon-nitrogen hydrolase family protein [bacterium]
MDRILAGVVQMTSTGDLEANLAASERLVRAAAARGARLVVLPENFAFIGDGTPGADARRLAIAERLPEGGAIVARMAALARAEKIHLVLGAMPEHCPDDPARAWNTQVVLDPEGRVVGRYRKIHLFDVTFDDAPSFRESRSIVPGDTPVSVALPGVHLGLTICYDLRFPELYRHLALGGAEAFTVPAAFTLHTGKDHWEPLLRARAIENGAWVLAAAQWGTHSPGRASWGKAAIVDPWGNVVAMASEGEGIAVAELDGALSARVRRSLPTLTHVRAKPGF